MRIVEVVADRKHAKTLTGMARFYGAEDHWWAGEGPDGRIAIRMVVPDEKRQALIDSLQDVFKADARARIVVQSLDAILTRDGPVKQEAEDRRAKTVTATREELYTHCWRRSWSFFSRESNHARGRSATAPSSRWRSTFPSGPCCWRSWWPSS